MQIDTLIVEDEPHSRAYLRELLTDDEEIILLADQRNGAEALNIIIQKRPQLIFLDIQMPGLNGIDLLSSIRKHYDPVVIYTTAYDDYAIKAFDLEAVDYLLKPFDKIRLEKSVERAKKQISLKLKGNLSDSISHLMDDFSKSQKPYMSKIEIREKGLVIIVNLHDVLMIEATDVYVTLHSKERNFLYRTSLNLLQSHLDPSRFIRIHRSFIVNTDFVQQFIYQNNNTFKIRLEGGRELTSSRSYKDAIAEFLGK